MAYVDRAEFDTIRSAATGAIGATYATIGTALTSSATVVCFKNNTNGDVVVSTDGVNDKLFFTANSYAVWDIRTNSMTNNDYLFPKGTQFYVKDGTTASTTGTFYIEVLIARVQQ